MRLLRSARSVFSFVLVLLWLGAVASPLLYLIVVPLVWLRRDWDRRLVSPYMRLICHGIFSCLRLGGARFERTGQLPGHEAGLIVMNHQSLLDICSVSLMASAVPAFVTRARYARFIPVISRCIHLLRSPVVDPRRDAAGALAVLRRAALEADHGLLIFPEGHRSRDGEIGPFKAGGIQAILAARPMPVWLVVTDGVWAGRRLVDFVLNIHRLRGHSELVMRLDPPSSPDELPAFVSRLRETMVAHLRMMRERGR